MAPNQISEENGVTVPSPFKPAHIVFTHQQDGMGADSMVISQPDFAGWSVHNLTIKKGSLGDAAKAVRLCASQQQVLAALADQSFSFEEWGCCLSVICRLKAEHIDQDIQDQLIGIMLERRANVTHKGRGMAMFYGDLFFLTNHHKVGLACVSYYRERYTGDYEGKRYLDDGDIETLVRMVKPESPVRAEAYDLAKEFIHKGPVNHSRRIKLYEGLICYAPDTDERNDQIDELRYYYVDLLQARYVFRSEDISLLTRMAGDKRNTIFKDSFTALLTYMTKRDACYFIYAKMTRDARSNIPKSSLTVSLAYGTESGTSHFDYTEQNSPKQVEDSGHYAQYAALQAIVDDYLEHTRNERVISLKGLNALEDFSKKQLDPETSKNLLLLSNFLRRWYSVQVDLDEFTVALP